MVIEERLSSPPSPSSQSTCRITGLLVSPLNTQLSVQPLAVVFQCFMNSAKLVRVSTILNCTFSVTGIWKVVSIGESKPLPDTCSVLPSERILNLLPPAGGG